MNIPHLDVGRLPARKPFVAQQRDSYGESDGVSDSEPLPMWTDLSTPKGQSSMKESTKTIAAPGMAFPGALPLGIDLSGGYVSEGADGSVYSGAVDYRQPKGRATGGAPVVDHRQAPQHGVNSGSSKGSSKAKSIVDHRLQGSNVIKAVQPFQGGTTTTVKDHRLNRPKPSSLSSKEQKQIKPSDFSMASMVRQNVDFSYDIGGSASSSFDAATHVGSLPLFSTVNSIAKDSSLKTKPRLDAVTDHRKKKAAVADVKDYRKEAAPKTKVVKDYRQEQAAATSHEAARSVIVDHRQQSIDGKPQFTNGKSPIPAYRAAQKPDPMPLPIDPSPALAGTPERPKALRPLPSLPAQARAKLVQQLPAFRPLPKIPKKKKEPHPEGPIILILTLTLPWLGDDAREVPGEFMEQREYEGKFIAVNKLWQAVTHLLETRKQTTGALVARWIRQRADDALVRAAIRDMVWEVRKRAMYTVRFKRYTVRSAKRLGMFSYHAARRIAVAAGIVSAAAALLLVIAFVYLVNNFLLPAAQLYLEYMFPEMREGHDSPIRCMHMLPDSDGDLLVIAGADDGCAVMWNVISSEDDSNSSSSDEGGDDVEDRVGGLRRTASTNALAIGKAPLVNAEPQGFYKERQKLHGLSITCIYYFRDHTKKRREFIATGCQDGSVRIWSGNLGSDHVNFKAVQTFSTRMEEDSSDDDSLEEWEMTTKEKRRRRAKRQAEEMLKPPQQPVTSLHATANGYYLAAGFRENEAVMWVVESAEIFARFRCDDSSSDISCVQTYQYDSKLLLATGNSTGASIWGVRAGWRMHFLEHDAAVTALHFVIDDETGESTKMITGDAEGMVRLWNTAGESVLHVFSGHCRPVKSLCIVDNDMLGESVLLSASADGTAKLWSIERRCVMTTMMGNQGGASCASAEKNGEGLWKVVVASRRGYINVWDGAALRAQLDEVLGRSRSKRRGEEDGVPDEEEVDKIKEDIAAVKLEQQEAEMTLAAMTNELEIKTQARDDKKTHEESLEKAMIRQKQKRDAVIAKYKRQAGLEMGLTDASAQEIVDGVLMDATAAGSAPLLREIAVLHVELGEVGEELGECKRELREYRSVLEKLPDDISKQQEHIVVVKKRVSDMETSKDKMINDIRRNKQRTQATLDNTRQDLASVEAKIESTQASTDGHERTLAEATEEGEDQRKQAKAHRKKATKLSSEVDKKQKDIDSTIEKYIRQAKETNGTPEDTSQAMVDMVLEDGRTAGKVPLLKRLATFNEDCAGLQEQLRLEDAGANSAEAAAHDAESRAAVASEQLNLARTHLDDLISRKAALDEALQAVFSKSAANNINTAAGRAAARKAMEEEAAQITLNHPSEVLRHIPVYPFLATVGRHLLVFLQLMAFPLDKAYSWEPQLRAISRVCEWSMLDFPITKSVFVFKFSLVIALIVGTAYTVLARDYRHEWRLQWRTLVARVGTGAAVPLEERREWLDKIAEIERNTERLTYLHTFITTVGLLIILRTLMDAYDCSGNQNEIHRPYECGSGSNISLIVLSTLFLLLFSPMLTLGAPYQGVVMPKIHRIPSGEGIFESAEWQKWFKLYFQQTIAARMMAVCEHLSRSNHTLRFSHYEEVSWQEYCATLHRRSPFIPSKNALLYNFTEGCVKFIVCITHAALAQGMPVFAAALQMISFGVLHRLSCTSPPYKSLAPNLWVQGMNLCLAWTALMAICSSATQGTSNATVQLIFFVGVAVIMLRSGELLRNISGNLSSLAIICWMFAVIISAVYATTLWAVLCLFFPLGFAFLKLFLPCFLRIIGILLCDRKSAKMFGLR